MNAGAALGMGSWSLTGPTVTSIDEALTYKGAFSEGAGATLTLGAGHTTNLTGTSSLSGTVNGASTIKLSNGTVSGRSATRARP